MSHTSDRDGTEVNRDREEKRPETRLRMWPAVVIALAYLAVVLGFALFGSTNIQSFVGLVFVPIGAALLIIIWWLAASRAPLLDRPVGLVLFVAALAGVVYAQKSNGAMLLAYAVPAMTLGVVVVLVATARLRWPTRRWVVLGFMVACAGVFTAMRVDTIGGNLAPIVSWRWSPTAEERSKALPPLEAHDSAVLPAETNSGDWTGFRGAKREGRVTETKFSTDWGTPPRELWRRKIGPAWSSFTAVGDYVFTQEQRGEEELVTCYRAESGKDVWTNRVDARYEDTAGLGPRATPTYDQGRLYTQGATGVLQCLDASTGNAIWKRNLAADADTKVPGYGFSSSPLVEGNLVIAFSCGGEEKSVVAYDRTSGDITWRAGHGTSGYSSPQIALIDQVPQVLMVSDFGMQSFTPETGAPLWEHAWKAKTNPRCIQPLVVDSNLVMLGATGVIGSRLLRVEKKEASWDVKEEWMTKSFRPYFNDCVLHKGFCYGFDGERFACVDIKTGERRWEGKRYGGQLLLFPDMDVLLVLSEAGDVILLQAIPERFSEIARFKAIAGKTWNHPVVAHGRLFVRNSEEAACFELPGILPAKTP